MSTSSRSLLSTIWHKVSGQILLAPGEIVRWGSSLNRTRLAWGSIGLAAIILLAGNLISSTLFRNMRADLTQDQLYTISGATKGVLGKLEDPLTLRMYFSRKLGEVSPSHLKIYERVRGILEQYNRHAGGKIDLRFLDPEPFSDAEERAQAGGLTGRPLGDGESVYFGLVAENRTDQRETIEFFTPERERFLEYDLTKMIHGLSNPKKRVVGVISSLPIDGGMANPMMGRQAPPRPWVITEHLREFFEVKGLGLDVRNIPAGIDVLVLIQPAGLSKDALYAIDQFALKGGRILAFVDPNPAFAQAPMGGMPGMMMPGAGQPVDAEFIALMKTWGIEHDAAKVATNFRQALRIQSGTNPGLFFLDKSAIPALDVLAGDLKMLFHTPGVVAKAAGAKTDFQPLLSVGPEGAVVAAAKFQTGQWDQHQVGGPDLKPAGKPFAIAARVAGATQTHFPAGRPKVEEPKAEKKDEKTEEKKDSGAAPAPAPAPKAAEAQPPKAAEAQPAPAPKADAAAAKTAEAPKVEAAKEGGAAQRPTKAEKQAEPAKAGEAAPAPAPAKADSPAPAAEKVAEKPKEAAKPAEPDPPHVGSGTISIVVIADTDFLQDPLWVRVQEPQRGGQQVAIAWTHNGTFVINALENLAGGTAFQGLRGRGVTERPLEAIEAIKREAERRHQQEEKRLDARLKELKQHLANVQVKGDGQVILSEKEKQAVKSFEAEYNVVRRRLREVQLAQRQEIESMQSRLKLINIAAVPILIGVLGLMLAGMRRRRTTSA